VYLVSCHCNSKREVSKALVDLTTSADKSAVRDLEQLKGKNEQVL